MVRSAIVDVWERFFNDDTGKDALLRASDGKVPVHSVFLAVLSDPLRCMLSGEMQEAQTREIDMNEFTSAQLRFILRLAYTGHIDSLDWTQQPGGDKAEALEMDGGIPRLPDRGPTRSRDRSRSSDRRLSRVRLTHLRSERPRDLSSCRSVSPVSVSPPQKIPLELLFGCASFSKKYDVAGFLSVTAQKIKEHVDENTFDKIMRFAISLDVCPLKMYCIRYAELSRNIRTMYDRRSLSPEVMFELQALWDLPPILTRRGTRELF